MDFFKGIGALLLTLAAFSVFTIKCPKGDKAMGGLADAAVATFLVEAIFKYICGDFAGIAFLGEVGAASGGMGAVASCALVGISMGTSPMFAVAAAAACSGFGILPGFIAAYILHFILKKTVRYLPAGLDVIVGALAAAAIARSIAMFTEPAVNAVIGIVGTSIDVATTQSPILMGLILGGLMKPICTSPLSSMALTAMLGLTGLPMGIAAVACFGGSFTNAIVFKQLKLGDNGRVLAVMLEPLTQADIITKNPLPIYGSNFFGGAISGVVAAVLGIVNNAPGTASPIPGLLAPFAFNDPMKVILAMALAAVGGTLAGFAGSAVFKKLGFGNDVIPD
ncbi:MAG: PTS sugar transporter subunit IIC [Oscillospiraceae bacterium]|nr:PTS sugar transporter subunit IIC [Oscillospiraceae bacterium]